MIAILGVNGAITHKLLGACSEGGGCEAMTAGPRPSRPSTEALRAPDRRRLYEQLVARLLDYVEVTGLKVGDRLPSERDLAGALQVSRASVRQATVALEV